MNSTILFEIGNINDYNKIYCNWFMDYNYLFLEKTAEICTFLKILIKLCKLWKCNKENICKKGKNLLWLMCISIKDVFCKVKKLLLLFNRKKEVSCKNRSKVNIEQAYFFFLISLKNLRIRKIVQQKPVF